MKVSNIIMAYKNPEQIERLIKSMNHPCFYFYIHLDKKIDIKDYEFLSQMERVSFIRERVLCNWGGYSFVKAILASLSEVVKTCDELDFINLLSAQDYPIKPINNIYEFLEKNIGLNFISYDEDPQRKWWHHASKRSELYHLTDFSFKGKYLVQGVINKYLPRRKFPLPVELYGSSDSSWWTITNECAKYIINFMDQNKKLNDFMKYTWGADEFLIATIIMNSIFASKTVNNNLRLITWVDGVSNPKVLAIKDFDIIKTSDRLFSRKFDTTIDTQILNEIDLNILQSS